ncbi:conserved hypothetical protein [Candidatus Desulfarcum epimagneticum]|uniref:ParB/Spo0J HTH domain-containing protein n=1 Tax=uncultured Desulfobacteraceae bacterium TaxID=218296 RepID=A0A484HK11_9BACT|nr:conserved hypothetical protein [uncultured Desulfobacteraceae bacterium]
MVARSGGVVNGDVGRKSKSPGECSPGLLVIKKAVRRRLEFFGSPDCPIERTFTTTVYFAPKPIKKHITHCKKYRNPINVAQEYADMINNGECQSQSDIARRFGISRVRVNQFMSLLKLDDEIITAVKNLGDPLSSQIVTERMLRPYINCSVIEQQRNLENIFKRNAV